LLLAFTEVNVKPAAAINKILLFILFSMIFKINFL